MSGRIPCIIPFCRRTASAEKFPGCTEIICARCGRLVPKARQVYRRAQREAKRVCEMADAARTPENCARIQHARVRCDRLWSAFRRKAIEAAAGIAS